MTDFAGEFETHLTVRLGGATGEEESLGRWAVRHGLKYTYILLDRGRMPDQPMLTYLGRGTLAEQRTTARAWARRLASEGFELARVKIEAAPGNGDVPQTDRDAAALPPGCYFEHHVKLLLAGEDQVAPVRALAQPHAAHVSRNARRALPAGQHERFVTQRCRDVGRPTARRRLDALLAAVAAAGFPVLEVHEEFVVHDDNPAVDAGWIDELGTGEA